MQHAPQQSIFDRAFSLLIPVGFIALFLVGVPLGYKLILGGRKSTVEQGTLHRVILINPILGEDLSGRNARIVSDYLIVELSPDRYLWIPETNIAGVEFKTNK